MINFTLEILNIFLLFRYVLGCEFRKTRGPIVIGIIVIAVDYVLRVIYYENMPLELGYVIILVSATLPIWFFSGRLATILGIGVTFHAATTVVYDLYWGVELVYEKGILDNINFEIFDEIARIICMIIISVLIAGFRKKREKIYLYVTKLNPLIFLPIIVVVYVLRLNSGYSGAVDPDLALVIQGLNLAKNSIIGVFTIMVYILVILLVSQKKELRRMLFINEKCIKEQTAQYQMIGIRDKELRKFRHDYNKHLAAMQDMAGDKKYKELADYVIQLAEVRSKINFISTDNIICDAIVNQYYDRCKENGIQFSVIGKMSTGVNIPETDLCIILSNGVENAYEAALQCEEKKSIHINIKSQGNFVLIEIRNSAKGEVIIDDGFIKTTKEDKENHGFGTKNMRDTVLHNGGSVTWSYDRKGFVITKIQLRGSREWIKKDETV